ncbi:hypothetical protein F5888DRAFT_1630854 [Russula emetica]|nr:hypothetical protein F5888DRAFT_1630854 [Russula emetica]
MSARRLSANTFANFFSDDMSDDASNYFPSMHDHIRDQAIAGTAAPRRRLRKLLMISMIMTLSMAVLAVHSMRIVTRIGLVSFTQTHQQVTTKILNHLSAQLVVAGILNDTTPLPLPQPPQSCKYNPQLCRLSLPWLYGSVVSLTCALGALKTIARVRKDFQEHEREMRAIRVGLGGAWVLFGVGILKFAQEYWSTKAAPRFSLLDRLSPQGCAQELTAARHAIDDELSALQMITCAMRTTRNNFSLIGRLPPEILSCVFSFHAINQPTPRDSIYNPDDPFPSSSSPIRLGLGWITVTHVCRRWRQVALSDPNLWRTIVFDLGAEWAEEMLARSKAALISYSRDLSFQPRVSRRRSLDDEVTLRKHLSHVRRLVLSGNPESLAPAVRALTTPAPHLESLELLRNAPQFRELCITLPSDLFAHNAPKLRHVILSGCAVPWDSPLFRDLTHLDIRIPPVVPFPRPAPASQSDLLSIPTLERLLSILEAMPSLQVLSLGNCLPRPGSTRTRVVPLRHMSKLSLDGSLSEVVAVLERRHTISPLSTIIIDEADYALSLTIMVWDTDVPLHRPPQFIPSAPARLHLTFGSRYRALVESLPLQICKALPLRDLQTLSITYPEAPCHCPKVTHLRVRASWAFTLAPTLEERNAFPSLVTLALQDINFFTSLSPEHTEPLGVVLLVILRARSNAGIPVRRVNLTSCVLAGTWIESLKEVVNDVIWDFDRGYDFDSETSSAVDYDSLSWSDDPIITATVQY